MAEPYICALDQGTTSSRCILFDRRGEIRSLAQREFRQIYPQPGWVEHDPMDIWKSQLAVVREAMEKIGASPEQIAAIGITNQRETAVLWDAETGEPVYHAIVWQCRRTAERIVQLEQDGMTGMIQQKTGLIPDAYFSASKIEWILDNVPGAREKAETGQLRFGTVDSWLIWKLTEGRVHATDYTNASRTMLYDIHRRCWDKELLDYFRIPETILPEVRPSSGNFGETTLFGGRIPITGVAGDQQAALFGQCGFNAGDVKNTYGTGGFMLMNTGTVAAESRHGLITTIAAGDGTQYALEGSVFVAGAALQWLRDGLQILDSAPESEQYCRAVEDTNGVYIVPAFAGLGAPYWESGARGTVVGLTRGVTRAHFIRATVESLAYQTDDLLQAMQNAAGVPIRTLKVDGGASANNFLLEFQSDISQITIQRPACIETTALGAAYLAGLAIGYWRNLEEIRENWRVGAAFTPTMDDDCRNALRRSWQRAVDCAIYWAGGSL